MLNAILFALYQSCTIIISVDCNQQNTPSLASPSLTVAAKKLQLPKALFGTGRFGPPIPGYLRKVNLDLPLSLA